MKENNFASFSLIFWTQNLDNISPDIIEKDGCPLEPKDQSNKLIRERFALQISNTSLSGITIFTGKNVTLTQYNEAYILRIIPIELDDRKRKTPIITYITNVNNYQFKNQEDELELPTFIFDSLSNFLSSVNRHLSIETEKEVHAALEIVKKT
jgi:hypothetical protein